MFVELDDGKWFIEKNEFWQGQAFSLKVENILFEKQSKYQNIVVFDSGTVWGRVLVLDGAIQLTQKDESSYHEMMTHVPLLSHPNPKRVLVIGGGDGGILRELALYGDSLTKIDICEIDGEVIETAKKYLPFVSCGFDNENVNVIVKDGSLLLDRGESGDLYDVIIVDSTDPNGIADTLFQKKFYTLASKNLKPDGILCCQAESIWIHLELIKKFARSAAEVFPVVQYAKIEVPTYPCGSIGMLLCSKDAKSSCSRPLRQPPSQNLKYYTPDIHEASFKLPKFAQDILSLGRESV